MYFLGIVLFARSLRYGGEAYLGVQLGEHSTQYLKDHTKQLAAFAVLLFVALYLLIRLSDRWRKPSAQGGR
jgi:membrane protein DedA with SNARE-associated domain